MNEFIVGDIVCAKTETADLDVTTLGRVSHILPKSSFIEMKTIKVDLYYNEKGFLGGFDFYAPQDLVKLDVKMLYQIMKINNLWKPYTQIPIKR